MERLWNTIKYYFALLCSPSLVTVAETKLILSMPHPVLAEAWCNLNRWGWPQWLPNECPKPHSFDLWHPNDRRAQVMRVIEKRVSHRLLSRTWNKSMSDEEFFFFYEGIYCNNREALTIHDRLSWQKAYAVAFQARVTTA